jgi:hypothetical protein
LHGKIVVDSWDRYDSIQCRMKGIQIRRVGENEIEQIADNSRY